MRSPSMSVPLVDFRSSSWTSCVAHFDDGVLARRLGVIEDEVGAGSGRRSRRGFFDPVDRAGIVFR